MLKPFGALAVGVLIAGLTFLVVHWPQSTGKTFSQHAAAQRASIIYYVALFAVVLPLLSLFFAGWFVPAKHISRWFDVLIIASAAFQFSVTFIPEVGGWKSTWHRALTFCSAILLLPCLLLAGKTIGGVSEAICGVCLVVMLALMLFAGKHRNGYRYSLWLQIAFYATFFGTILWLAYA